MDQTTKLIAQKCLEYGKEIPIIPLLSLTYVENTGIALGLFKGMNNFFIVTSILIISLLFLFRRKIVGNSKTNEFGLGLILGGAFGNLFDRIFRGTVIDFINLQFWSVFNVADAAITIGIAIIIIHSLFHKSVS